VASDKDYRQELLQVIAASHLAQISTEARAEKWNQQEYFADQAEIGNGARAERDELESVMSTGHGKVGSVELASDRGVGLALVALDHTPIGHAVVAFDLRDAADGGFQIEVWDNNRPGLASTITVHGDGTWEYPPLGWSGGPGEMTFQPEYPPRGLHLTEGGETSSGSDVTIAEVAADVHGLKTQAETDDGTSTDVSIQPEVTDTGSPGGHTSAVVTDGSKLTLSFADKHAGATVRGSGRVLSASGLTGQGGGRVTISYDVDAAKITAQSEQVGELTVTRGARHVASHGATELEMTRGGATTAKARGGSISLVLSSAVGSRLASTTLTLRVPKNSIVQVRGGLAKHAIRHGGQVVVSVHRGKRRSIVHLPTRSVASRYRLRAHIRVKDRRAKVRLSALRRLPRGTEAWVVWRASRGKKTLLRRRVVVLHPQIRRSLARTRLPGHLRGAEVKAIVHVVVNRPGPAELVTADSRRVQRGNRHRGHLGGHTGGGGGKHRHGHAHRG
jgi:hypothetical protein